MPATTTHRPKKIFSLHLLCWCIIALGAALRIVVFLQNRNFIIDEANVMRNIVERSFAGMLRPLNYEQFAPPVFLWVSKVSVSIFGAYDWAGRIYPLLCGIAGLLLFFMLCRQLRLKGAFYSLFLMATGVLYLRYATEFKQYSSDVVVTCALLLLALKLHPIHTSTKKLVGSWLLAGTLAVWLSMPSVFILAGIGCYYMYLLRHEWKRSKMLLMTGVMLWWVAMFVLHYLLILEPSIQSDFLERSHSIYFLYLWPANGAQWSQNEGALLGIIGTMGGHWTIAVIVNLLLMATGIWWLARQQRAYLLLLCVPVLALLLAAGLHQFTLMPRVSLFIYPILLLLIAAGLDFFMRFRYRKVAVPLLLAGCIITCINFNALRHFTLPMEYEWVTGNLAWMQKHPEVTTIYAHDLARPQLTYYTQIHPKKERWAVYKDFRTFYWNTNIDSLSRTITAPSFLVYAYIEEQEFQQEIPIFYNNFHFADSLVAPNRKVYLIQPK